MDAAHTSHEVRGVATSEDAAAALALLEDVADRRGAPVVDASEERRLVAVSDGAEVPGHRAFIAIRGNGAVGFLGGDGGHADLVVDEVAIIGPLLDAAEHLDQIWVRAATDGEIEALTDLGLAPARRLLVLGRRLEGRLPRADLPGGVEVRDYVAGHDDARISALLADAYAGTPDAGWDEERFRQHFGEGFDARDLLVAEGRRGDVVGIHWLKRRGDGVGEVHNLAVADDAQGLGLGRALLRAGLLRLSSRGVEEVILWVTETNTAAVELYRSEGFAPRWSDVAFTRPG